MNNQLFCEDCEWKGKQEDCVKSYRGIPGRDVEPYLQCPKCGSENLIELADRGVTLEPVPA